MQLVWIRMKKYRRFSDTQTLRFTGKLTALVGPNEAGKTSLLQLLQHLNHDQPFGQSDRTHDGTTEASGPVLEAAFFLDPSDREEISDLAGGERVHWLKVRKRANEDRQFVLEPVLKRDLALRGRAAGQLQRALRHRVLVDLDDSTVDSAKRALSVLENQADSIPPEDLDIVRQAAALLNIEAVSSGPKYMRELPEMLATVAEFESKEHPSDTAIQRLQARMPTFVLFDDDDRSLHSTYELPNLANQPSAALRNLAAVASLDLDGLLAAAEAGDLAEVNTIESKANDRLPESLGPAWSQSEIRVHFRTNGTTLDIQIRDERGRFSSLGERSDGLRQFVALLAFCTSKDVENPILLIDEAESHLHYDAQADLINILARQPVAQKVIYTTHSMGCLPEDLGAGIRLVEPIGTTSKIQDRFWSGSQPGLMPLLYGMGATTLAFLAIRAALLVEGPSDHILLPHIFKELAQRDYFGFQIVPGLSKSSRGQIPVLTSHGSRVLYLVDNDRGGEDLAKWLKQQGINPHLVLPIAPKRNPLRTVEDAIDSQVFIEAVNRYLKKWGEGNDTILRPTDVPRYNRVEALEGWCKQNGHVVPGKVDLAYEVVEVLLDDPSRKVVESGKARILKHLSDELDRKFNQLREET